MTAIIDENTISPLKTFIRGQSSVKTYTKSLILNLIILFLAMIIAMLLYKGGFEIGKLEISDIDDEIKNPIGLWFFKIGFVLCGLWFAPNALNIARRLVAFNKILGGIAGFFYVAAGFGMIIIAFSPTRVSYPMHIVGAIVGFGSLILSLLISFILFLVKIFKKFNWRALLIGFIFYGPFFIVVYLAIVNAGIPLLNSLNQGIPFGQFTPLGWEYYEWGAFFTGLYSIIGTHFLFFDAFETK